MKCKHNPDHVVTKYDVDGIPEPYELSYNECLDCGTWLPLGQSNDDSEAVEQEILAAELAADMRDGVGVGGHRPDHCNGEHCWHWFDDDTALCCYCDSGGLFTTCDAGYLARCIATHQDDTP